jgi:hypothetical protein
VSYSEIWGAGNNVLSAARNDALLSPTVLHAGLGGASQVLAAAPPMLHTALNTQWCNGMVVTLRALTASADVYGQ